MDALSEAFQHHTWATEKLIRHLRGLPEAALSASSAGVYGEVLATLSHLLAADGRYLANLEGTVPPPRRPGPDPPSVPRPAGGSGSRPGGSLADRAGSRRRDRRHAGRPRRPTGDSPCDEPPGGPGPPPRQRPPHPDLHGPLVERLRGAGPGRLVLLDGPPLRPRPLDRGAGRSSVRAALPGRPARGS